MIVAELIAWLSEQHPSSPVAIVGIGERGESVQERDIVLGSGQGPSDDLDEVILSWQHGPEAEALFQQRGR